MQSPKLDRQAVLLVVDQVYRPWRWLERLEHKLQALLSNEINHLVGHGADDAGAGESRRRLQHRWC